MFRGLLFRSLRDRHGFWLGAAVSAVMFARSEFRVKTPEGS